MRALLKTAVVGGMANVFGVDVAICVECTKEMAPDLNLFGT